MKTLLMWTCLACLALWLPSPASGQQEKSARTEKTQSSYKYWDRSAGKKEHKRSDFDPELDPRLQKQDAVGVDTVGKIMTPKFRWAQDGRQVFITVVVKNLVDITLEHNAHWLNFTAARWTQEDNIVIGHPGASCSLAGFHCFSVGDTQRTVGARLDSVDDREQTARQGAYALQLPLTRPVDSERTTHRQSEGYTVFVLRKQIRNSEWTHLLKEPARTHYKHRMSVDFKKFDVAEDEDDEVAFKVEKVTSVNVDDVIATPGPVILMFMPSWVPRGYSRPWIQNFGAAAEALEGRATFGRVNALGEPKLLERFEIFPDQMSQRDGNESTPVYRIFNDGGWMIPESFGHYEVMQGKPMADLVVRMEDVCDTQPCPSVHAFREESELNLVIGRREWSVVAIGMKESDALSGPLSNASRSLQVLGAPPVGVGWMAGGLAFNAFQSLLGSMVKLDLKTVEFPALILIRVPGAPEDAPAGAAPPIMIVQAAVARPRGGKKFKNDELKATIAGWGLKAKGIQEGWEWSNVNLALRCSVPSVLLQLSTASRTKDDVGAETPDAVALQAMHSLNGDNDLPAIQLLLNVGSKSGSAAIQHMAREYGLPLATADKPSLAVIHKERAYTFTNDFTVSEDANKAKKFVADVISGKIRASVRSQKVPTVRHGPGSGQIDTVVARTAIKFLQQADCSTVSKRDAEPLDVVIVIYDSTAEASSNRQRNAAKVAEKVAHVATMVFGSFDTSKNDLPAALEQRLGSDPKKYDGIWIFPAADCGQDNSTETKVSVGKRSKRKISTKEIAAWVKKSASINFPAKPAPLPPGPYQQSCAGCRVMNTRHGALLKCNSCDGSAPTANHEYPLDESCTNYANEGGVLQCASGVVDQTASTTNDRDSREEL